MSTTPGLFCTTFCHFLGMGEKLPSRWAQHGSREELGIFRGIPCESFVSILPLVHPAISIVAAAVCFVISTLFPVRCSYFNP